MNILQPEKVMPRKNRRQICDLLDEVKSMNGFCYFMFPINKITTNLHKFKSHLRIIRLLIEYYCKSCLIKA